MRILLSRIRVGFLDPSHAYRAHVPVVRNPQRRALRSLIAMYGSIQRRQ